MDSTPLPPDWVSLLIDAFDRVHETLHQIVSELTPEQLGHRPAPQANPIGWITWHLTRVQDDHLAGVADTDQVWTADGWHERFALPYPVEAVGYGQSSEQVGEFGANDPALLLGYADAVHVRTTEILRQLGRTSLDTVVDTSWDPPVTLGVRLVSVVNDTTQHVGQIGYLNGLLPAQ